MAGAEDDAQVPSAVGDRFPALRGLEEQVERARLAQALAQAEAATATAAVPKFDVALESDTVTSSDKTTALVSVLTQGPAGWLAHDIAGIALDAALREAEAIAAALQEFEAEVESERSYRFFVSTDPSIVGGRDSLHLLRKVLAGLTVRLDAYCGPQELPGEVEDDQRLGEAVGEEGAEYDADSGTEEDAGGGQEATLPLSPAVAGVVITGVLQAVGLVTRVLKRSYVFSGGAADLANLGFDLSLANALWLRAHSDEVVVADVDRFTTAIGTEIADSVMRLAQRADTQLVNALSAARVNVATATARSDAVAAEIEALNAQILKLIDEEQAATLTPPPQPAEGAPPTGLDQLETDRRRLVGSLPELAKARAAAEARLNEGQLLRTDLMAFLGQCLTPAADGRPPLISAARAEAMTQVNGSAHSFVLYARPLAGGLDQTVETKLGADHWFKLAGLSVEFCCLTAEGRTIAADVRTALVATSAKLDDPSTFEQERVGNGPYDRANRAGR